MMAPVAYGLGVLTSLLCALLLVRSYRKQRTPLLLWCCSCFVGLALNNVLLFTDLFLVSTNLEIFRHAVALAALVLLLVGLIGEES